MTEKYYNDFPTHPSHSHSLLFLLFNEDNVWVAVTFNSCVHTSETAARWLIDIMLENIQILLQMLIKTLVLWLSPTRNLAWISSCTTRRWFYIILGLASVRLLGFYPQRPSLSGHTASVYVISVLFCSVKDSCLSPVSLLGLLSHIVSKEMKSSHFTQFGVRV